MTELNRSNEALKRIVKEKYDRISQSSSAKPGCGCSEGPGCGSDRGEISYSVMAEDYSTLEGYAQEADLGLGCGLPTEYAGLEAGQTVVDLGSGAGNDCFVARREVGSEGRVIGVDFSESMVEKAKENAEKLQYDNVEFYAGDIEEIPLDTNIADVVVSNCVLNLVPDKKKAFEEIQRILKPGGHFSISDIVTSGKLPGEVSRAAELYAGCVTGAMVKAAYLDLIRGSGFEKILVRKERKIEIPDEVLEPYLGNDALNRFRDSSVGLYSITVNGVKPA